MNNEGSELTPNRHVRALFTFLALIPLVYFIPDWITKYVSHNRFLVTVMAVAIIVPILSYLILPGMINVWSAVKGNVRRRED